MGEVNAIRRKVDVAFVIAVRLTNVDGNGKTYFRQDKNPPVINWKPFAIPDGVRWINEKPYSKLDLCTWTSDTAAEDIPAWSTAFYFIDADGVRLTYQDSDDVTQDLELTDLYLASVGMDPEGFYASLPTIAGVEVEHEFLNCTGEMDLSSPALFLFEARTDQTEFYI